MTMEATLTRTTAAPAITTLGLGLGSGVEVGIVGEHFTVTVYRRQLSKDRFNEEMERCGVYIPHADAQWEMPENSNFYRGRESSRPGSQYEVIKYGTCGQSGVHIARGNLEFRNPLYVCETCQPGDSTETSDSDDSCDDELVKEALLVVRPS